MRTPPAGRPDGLWHACTHARIPAVSLFLSPSPSPSPSPSCRTPALTTTMMGTDIMPHVSCVKRHHHKVPWFRRRPELRLARPGSGPASRASSPERLRLAVRGGGLQPKTDGGSDRRPYLHDAWRTMHDACSLPATLGPTSRSSWFLESAAGRRFRHVFMYVALGTLFCPGCPELAHAVRGSAGSLMDGGEEHRIERLM